MRQVSSADIATIYFKSPPSLLGEVFAIFGLGMLVLGFPELEIMLGGIVFSLVGAFLVRRKYIITLQGVAALRSGTATICRLARISDTNETHNERRVKKYSFTFEANGRTHTHSFKSAYHRQLELGDQLQLFYLMEDPTIAFIPGLYFTHNKWA